MQKLLDGFAFRYFDLRNYNLNLRVEDYVNVALLFFEFYAEKSTYKWMLELQADRILTEYSRFIDPNTLQYSDALRLQCYQRQEIHRVKNGVDLYELGKWLDSFESRVKMTEFKWSDASIDHKWHANAHDYTIKVSRNFVRDLHDVPTGVAKYVLDKYFYPIARGHIREKCKLG